MTVKDQASFRALDMNQPAEPGTETLVPMDKWKKCLTRALPDPSGECYVGIDMGGNESLTAVSVFYLDTGLLETMGGLPDEPSLKKRGLADNANYEAMARDGELIVAGNQTTDVSPIIAYFAERLKDHGCKVLGAAADFYRKTEVVQAMADAKVNWKMDFRRTGSAGRLESRMFGSSKRPCWTARLCPHIPS